MQQRKEWHGGNFALPWTPGGLSRPEARLRSQLLLEMCSHRLPGLTDWLFNSHEPSKPKTRLRSRLVPEMCSSRRSHTDWLINTRCSLLYVDWEGAWSITWPLILRRDEVRTRWEEIEMRWGWDEMRLRLDEMSVGWDEMKGDENEIKMRWWWDKMRWNENEMRWDESGMRWDEKR
jgi:hypothetical protein